MSANSLAGEEALKALPDMKISVRQVFGVNSGHGSAGLFQGGRARAGYDPDYHFDRDTTLAILAGFAITAA